MSVELRFVSEGNCDHGPKYHWEPRSDCWHYVECDWGRIEHPDPRPDRDEVGSLMLTSAEYVADLIANGPQVRRPGRVDSATRTHNPDRIFVHSDYAGRRWTWELFDAHWDDGVNNGHTWLIGRWPD